MLAHPGRAVSADSPVIYYTTQFHIVLLQNVKMRSSETPMNQAVEMINEIINLAKFYFDYNSYFSFGIFHTERKL